MSIDYGVMKNRSNLTDRIIRERFTDNQITHMFIRLLAYMETQSHPDRQEFWEYLEKIITEKKQTQLSLQMTEDKEVKNRLEDIDISGRPL